MKVYVCFEDYGEEGCSEPEKVFVTKEQANEYCRERERTRGSCDFIELELE